MSCPGLNGSERLRHQMNFRRPIPRARGAAPVYNGRGSTESRVSIICDLLALPIPQFSTKIAWRPPVDYMLIAKHLRPEDREAYILRSETWFKEHEPVNKVIEDQKKPLDYTLYTELLREYYPHNPPLDVKIPIMKSIGCSQAIIDRAIKRNARWTEDDEKDCEFLERVFGKSAPVKQAKKVIKAVKKKVVS